MFYIHFLCNLKQMNKHDNSRLNSGLLDKQYRTVAFMKIGAIIYSLVPISTNE